MDTLESFLRESPAAASVMLDARVILRRSRMSPEEVETRAAEGIYAQVPREERRCELEVGGQIVARGRLVTRGNRVFFKVTEGAEVKG